ncbi:DUF1488 family protein [Caballeronia sp. LZ016]|uniref:DUF1488 family protein n=1 Tax=Caballeronia sp. LZ016 TaxID=3038554 RepID=UPI00286031D1|nr:DUF1488 family protein [Caballeronia sp. LZ016]MDR5740152.1 DUF1488 family protein [Caballeronia sp. LZ016]
MNVPVPEPQISADKQTLSFVIEWRGESVTCVVPRRCLEVFFWLAPNADDARLVSVFRVGLLRSTRSRDASCWRDQRGRCG